MKLKEILEKLQATCVKTNSFGAEIKSIYGKDGGYIGLVGVSEREFEFLIDRGIVPEKKHPKDNVCSIGFSEKEQKWYGWSHRAYNGFVIGYIAREGHICTDFGVPVGFECKTLEDCKKCAIAFAESVG